MTKQSWILPSVTAILCLLLFILKTIPPSDIEGEMRIQEFGHLPVLYQGRIQPYTSLAQNALRMLSGRSTFEENGRKQPAIKWLLDVISDSHNAEQHRVIRIVNHQILESLGLERRSGYLYSISEIFSGSTKIFEQVKSARERINNGERLDTFDAQILQLSDKIGAYNLIKNSHILIVPHSDAELANIKQFHSELKGHIIPLAIPPLSEGEEWKPLMEAWTEDWESENKQDKQNAKQNPLTQIIGVMLKSYSHNDTEMFSISLMRYQQILNKNKYSAFNKSKVWLEFIITNTQPFFLCMSVYLTAFVLLCLSWTRYFKILNPVSESLILVTFIAHTIFLSLRIYISGRPPVTNLYSSAIFIGWGIVLTGLILERIHRTSIGNLVASVGGVSTLLIAHYLSLEGDTLRVLQAVLDTNFWLATHVVAVTLGYTTTFFAGLLGIIYIIRRAFTNFPTEEAKNISQMIYGVICFALFFSFVGTVLGGLWADDSWGRFWGWDPKENGALMIVLWNALIIHALWGRLIQERGLAILSVAGNIITSWSWFGTNTLGIGLHSYGQQESTVRWLIIFVLTQLLIITIGALHKKPKTIN
ncbi:MAG: cytochrome c biogenesis protein CcsA [Planctomycetes bacterium]|nr:cytochrome c biogenesis protein CcsA [Planctomycetota bacterium]